MTFGVRTVLALASLAALASPALAEPSAVRGAAAIAVAADATGEKAAAAAEALLRARVGSAAGLRLIEPGRVLSGDPLTQEEETRERARAALADGRLAYDALALDEAIARLGQAVTLYQRTGPLLGDLGELRSALAYLGAALVLRGSADEAESLFVELLTLEPGHALEGFPSAVQRVFERASARADAAPTGGLEVFSTPPRAAVYLDGRFEGVTPLVLDDVPSGRHHLRLEKLGYTMHGAPLVIAAGERVTSQTRLASLVGGAELRDLAGRSAEDVPREGMGGRLRELARTLGADTLVFVVAHQSGPEASLVGGVYDARTGQRIALDQIVLSMEAASFADRLERWLDRLVQAAASDTPLPTSLSPGGLPGPSVRTSRSEPATYTEAPRSGGPRGEVVLGWTLAGIGAAAVLTGVVLGVLAQDTHAELRDTPQASPRVVDLQDRGRAYALAADGLYVGGGVLTAGGVALALLAPLLGGSPIERVEGTAVSLGPALGGGATLGLGGRF